MLSNKNINVAIFGASGHAKVIVDILEQIGEYTIVGLVDSYKPIGTRLFDYEVIGREDNLQGLCKEYNFNAGIIAIGDNWNRLQMHQRVTKLVPEFNFINAIHPSSIIGKGVKIGNGVAIMAGTIINSDAIIADSCIINTKASVGHDSVLKSFSSLAPGVTLGGSVKIGMATAIGIGVSIKQNISIGDHTVVGSGSMVLNDVESLTLVMGIPAKKIQSIDKGYPYLN
ncbi:acetyltransferase [Spongiivirga citrea]|uniref:Transferase n=1 Tax=Spongiivirga citrea TaxID=1481457 RepID=A0A6M0CG78_9FLAO|nr:acetyltransferase [Spongiivirga citrea]NER16878.1 transferase [Spongiivirga citrea]